MASDHVAYKPDSPEVELLLLCAGPDRAPETSARLSALVANDMDWKFVLQAGGAHGVLPLLWQRLGSMDTSSIPDAVLGRLEKEGRKNAVATLALMRGLQAVVDQLLNAGVRVLPFKGVALAEMAYGDPTARPSGDIDLLVSEDDFIQAEEVLRSLGFKNVDANPERPKESRRSEMDVTTWYREEEDLTIELHRRLFPAHFHSGFRFDDLWSRASRTDPGGRRLPSMDNEDHLLVLCIHGAKHFWHRLIWISDIAHLMKHLRESQYERVLARSRSLACERMVCTGLTLACEMMGTPMPPQAARRAATAKGVQRVINQVRPRLFGRKPYRVVDRSILHLSHIETWRHRLRYLAFRARTLMQVNGIDRKCVNLPRSASALYPIVRILRLLKDYAGPETTSTWALIRPSLPRGRKNGPHKKAGHRGL